MTGQIIKIMEVPRGMGLGQWIHGQSASPRRAGRRLRERTLADGSKVFAGYCWFFSRQLFHGKCGGKKMKNKTKFCCILKVFLEERIVQYGAKSPELNQK